MPTKPKTNQPSTPNDPQLRDQFLTPNYGTDLIVPFLPKGVHIWECCSGLQNKMANRLQERGFEVTATTIENRYNCLEYLPDKFSYVVTNPPFSLKLKIVKRFIDLELPFAFLIPADWSIWLIEAVENYNCELIVPKRRISYITPTGKSGKQSQAQFHSLWITRHLCINRRLTFVDLTKEMMQNI